ARRLHSWLSDVVPPPAGAARHDCGQPVNPPAQARRSGLCRGRQDVPGPLARNLPEPQRPGSTCLRGLHRAAARTPRRRTMTSLATATGVTHRYGDVVALHDVDLEIGDAELVGMLGPNGAGKSTLLALLQGLRYPTKGTVRLFGKDP